MIVMECAALTVFGMGTCAGPGLDGGVCSWTSRVTFESKGIPYGEAGGGAAYVGEPTGPGAGEVGAKPGTVGESPSRPPPKPSPPWVRTGGSLRPEIFWKPRSLEVESTVLSVRIVAVDWRQRFMNAGAKYEAVKRFSLLGRSVISLVPSPAANAPAPAPAAASSEIAVCPFFPIKNPRRRRK